jgi:peptide/nickel transport system substrate-binding protein
VTERRLSRRAALQLMASTAGMALVAACGAAQQGPPAPAPPAPTVFATAAATRPSGQPISGGTLRVALPADLATLDGHTRTPQSLASIWLIYDRLTAYDDNLKPQPMLAESWDVSSDFKQVKFNLRKGVQFHTGRELTRLARSTR